MIGKVLRIRGLKPVLLQTLALALLALSLSSCGVVKRLWGEAPPAAKVAEQSAAPLPDFLLVFDDDEEIAVRTLDEWKRSLTETFDQIEGAKPGFLSIAEISTLVRKGYVRMEGDPEQSIRKVRGVLRLLGFKDGIAREDVRTLFAWLTDNRVRLRTFYRLFISSSVRHNPVTSGQMVELVDLFGSFVALNGQEPLVPAEMDEILNPWIPERYPHAKKALVSGIELGISFFASLCGDRVDLHRWNGRKIGRCLQDLTRHFDASGPVLDFLFGNLHPVDRRSELAVSNAQFVRAVETWLEGHRHPLFPTARVAKFADQLEIPAPYAFFKLTEWLPKLNADSNPQAFSPTFFVDLARVSQGWIGTFLRVSAQDRCRGPGGFTHADWRTCPFTGEFEPADQLYNDEYATLIRSKTLGFASKIALYDSVAAFLMSKLDPDGEGLAQAGIKDLITMAIRLVDSNAFAYNVVSRLQERPYDPSTAESALENVHRQGLSEVAALASELIPARARDKRGFLKKILVQLFDDTNKVGYRMDQLGITAFLYLYDLMTSMRAKYIADYALPVRSEGPLTWIRRREVVKAMPRILHDHFPHIYNECLDWGFERTCGVVYTEFIPSAPKGRDELETYEMDIITLSSILMESVINRCDRNGNDAIGARGLLGIDGNTEKNCVIKVVTALGKRLMAANIVDNDEQAKNLMEMVKKLPPLKWIAKVAMGRGSTKGVGMVVRALPPFSLFSRPASLGSILSLAAEVMDADKTKAIEEGRMGPVADPGDEMIYLEYLTKSVIPSHDPAQRTSERARAWQDKDEE